MEFTNYILHHSLIESDHLEAAQLRRPPQVASKFSTRRRAPRPETKGRAQRGARGPARRAAPAAASRAHPHFTSHTAY